MLTHGSLFAGIGGFDLGFERAGIKTIWQVENDPYCLKVLEKHWPDVKRYQDIREVDFACDDPILLAVDFPANLFRLQAADLERLTRDGCGPNMPAPFAYLDRVTLLWKMFQGSLFTEWDEFCGTWPLAGMMRNGIIYPQGDWARTTDATGYLSPPIVPTPLACDHKGSGRPEGRKAKGRGPGNNLRDYFRMKDGFLYPPVRLVEYLMGYPIGFTDLNVSATP